MSAPIPAEIIRSNGVTLVAFPASWLALEVDVSGTNTASRPETARQVWTRIPEALALIDGPMFAVDDGLPYSTSQRDRLLYRYLDVSRGINVASVWPTRGATLSVANGRAMMAPGSIEQPGSTFAVQGYPTIVRGGGNVANPTSDTEQVGRAAIVLLSDGRVGFAVDTIGMYAFGQALIALRAANGASVTDAVYSDGGGSTALALRNASGGANVVAIGMDARRVPAYVLAIPPSDSSVGKVLAIGGGLALGGLAAWFALKR